MHSNQILLFFLALAFCLAVSSANALTGGAPCVTNTDCTFGVQTGYGATVDGGTCINGFCDCVTQVGVGSIGSFCQCRPDGADCGSGLDYWFNGVRSCVTTCPEPQSGPAQWSAATIAAFNNPANGYSWTAGVNPVFNGMTLAQAAAMCGTFVSTTGPAPSSVSSRNLDVFNSDVSTLSIPASFNSATNWPYCANLISTIRNQADCGSCWAFSATEVLQDRACVATQGSLIEVLSPQDLVSCSTQNAGCNGGWLDRTWNYMQSYGVELDNMFPYTSGNNFVTGSCGNHLTLHPRTYSINWSWLTTVASMQAAIQANGPIQTAFYVYSDFYNYVSGVYHHVTGGLEGGHAIKVVGWGVQAGTNIPYWIVNNSWGTGWGMNGVFWIKRGNNECYFESNSVTGFYNTIS